MKKFNLNIYFLLLIISIFFISFSAGCSYNKSANSKDNYGKDDTMYHIPLIDKEISADIKTATFAMG